MPEPAPLAFVWDGLIPEGFPSSLFGDGATGKSYLALGLATHIALGHPFLGRPVTHGPVLYIDAELDDREFRRRAYRAGRGSGLDAPAEGLYYLKLDAPLDDDGIGRVSEIVMKIRPALVILDSFTAAAYSDDPKSAVEVTALIKRVEKWGTTLIIDHVPKSLPGASAAPSRPFGSTFKFNLVRSAISAVRAEGGGVTLRQVKSNFALPLEPIHVATIFTDDSVEYELITPSDTRLAGIENRPSAKDEVLLAVSAFGADGATPHQLAEEVGKNLKTVRNYLAMLRRSGTVEPDGHGRWRIPESQTP